MIRHLTGALVGVTLLAGAATAADFEGKLKSVDPAKNKIVLTIDGKDKEFVVSEKTDMTVQDVKPYTPKDGLKDEAFKTKDRLVRLVTETRDGKEVVTKLTIFTGRRG